MTGNKKIANVLRTSSVITKDASQVIWVYSEELTERLDYVCDFIFRHFLKVEYKVITSQDLITEKDTPLINYSHNKNLGGIQIKPEGLIFEKGIRKNSPEVKRDHEDFFLFPDKDGNYFDIFSAVFFMIARYEEWQDHPVDQHGRFELQQSILFKNNVHLHPVVDEWILSLQKMILTQYPSFQFPSREFRTLASIDVDNLFAYKYKGFVRTLGANVKDLLKMNFKNIERRRKVIDGREKDPFDIYDTFSEFCLSNNIPLIYFFLFSDKGKYNRTVDPGSAIFSVVFDRVRKNAAAIGLHPGYDSKKSESAFSIENENFSKAANEKTEFTRQHYLRFDIKETPNLLMKKGITADFSMGFASGSGFRAGTSEAYHYYDLEKERRTDFILVPFCAMDGAYFIYQNISAEQAYAELMQIKKAVQKVNGLFTTVFHERTFDEELYPGFGEMYKRLLTN